MSDRPRKVTPEEAKWKAEAWSEETNWPGASLLASQAFARRAARAEWENAKMREVLDQIATIRGTVATDNERRAREVLEEVNR